MIKIKRKKYIYKCSVSDIDEFINIDAYKMQEDKSIHANQFYLDENISNDLKKGYKVYIVYNTNGKMRKQKKFISAEK